MAGAIAIIILAMLIGFIPGYIWGKSDREDKANKAAEQKPVIEKKEYNLRTYHEVVEYVDLEHQEAVIHGMYHKIADSLHADGIGIITADDTPIVDFERVELTITVAEEDKE